MFIESITGDNGHAKATQATTNSTAMVKARETALSKNKIANISAMKKCTLQLETTCQIA